MYYPKTVPLTLRSGGSRTIKLPEQYDEYGEAKAKFERACRLIETELKARAVALEQLPKTPKGNRKQNCYDWMKPACYVLISSVLELEYNQIFLDRLERHHRYPRSDPATLGPFQLGLNAVFANDGPADQCLAPDIRYRISRELFYAYRHFIPHELINGFLVQVGGVLSSLERKDGESIEPQFREWVIFHLLNTSLSHEGRGTYPKSIGDELRKRRTALGEVDVRRPLVTCPLCNAEFNPPQTDADDWDDDGFTGTVEPDDANWDED